MKLTEDQRQEIIIALGQQDHNWLRSMIDPSWCPIHSVVMELIEEDGKCWYSHKAPDDTWCKGV